MPISHLDPAATTFIFFLLSIILCFPGITRSDDPCPYPCYPPPTGTTTPATGTTIPPPPPQTVSAYPQPSGLINPYTPPASYGGGGGGGGGGSGFYGSPPPPDPILPYFPFYFRKPPHQTEENSGAAITSGKWRGMIGTTTTLFSLLFLFA